MSVACPNRSSRDTCDTCDPCQGPGPWRVSLWVHPAICDPSPGYCSLVTRIARNTRGICWGTGRWWHFATNVSYLFSSHRPGRNAQFLVFWWFDHVVTRNARRIIRFIVHPVDDHTLLWMSDIFLKSHRPEWTIGWRLAGMGLFRTHQVTLSWVGPELISNNIILDIIPRLSKAASDTKFDILPQFTYTYAFNLPQTPNFLALTLTNSSLSPRQENIYTRIWCKMSLCKCFCKLIE